MACTLLIGHATDVLKTLPDKSVQTCITSPPYFGLRDYGTATWEGGDTTCKHSDAVARGSGGDPNRKQLTNVGSIAHRYKNVCKVCGAVRTDYQLGLEDTAEQFIENLVAVFREVMRVLRDDGTLWVVIGDSYHNLRTYMGGVTMKQSFHNTRHGQPVSGASNRSQRLAGVKDKELIGIPWMLAFALRADGWYVRSDIIWSKPNPMPESVKDRCTSSHEHVFMLSKKVRYYYDGEAIKEPSSGNPVTAARRGRADLGTVGTHGLYGTGKGQSGVGANVDARGDDRNKRDVWTIATAPYPGAHYATFPSGLVEPMILAATSPQACEICGAPWKRVTETEYRVHEKWFGDKQAARHSRGPQGQAYKEPIGTVTLGWKATCVCTLHSNHHDLLPGDMEQINTPTGTRVAEDPSLITGRAGMNRPRGAGEGSSPTTRYEQRKYAAQLRASAHLDEMAAEVGTTTLDHYKRTDRAGARPIPPGTLRAWLDRGWLVRVEPPVAELAHGSARSVVLDPFFGSGVTGKVALSHGRDFIGIDLDPRNLALAHQRIGPLLLALHERVTDDGYLEGDDCATGEAVGG